MQAVLRPHLCLLQLFPWNPGYVCLSPPWPSLVLMKAQKIWSCIFKVPIIFLVPTRFFSYRRELSLSSLSICLSIFWAMKNVSIKQGMDLTVCFWQQESLEVRLALHHHSACLWASISSLFSSSIDLPPSLTSLAWYTDTHLYTQCCFSTIELYPLKSRKGTHALHCNSYPFHLIKSEEVDGFLHILQKGKVKVRLPKAQSKL